MTKKVKKRKVVPDPLYNSETVAKFVNHIMWDGKKSVARKIVYRAFEIIKEKTKREPLEVFEQALENAGPFMEVRPMRVGGASYQVPREVGPERRMTLAMRWIIEAARNKKGKPMAEKLAQELLDAANNTGAAINKKETMHKMAEANKAFAHLAR